MATRRLCCGDSFLRLAIGSHCRGLRLLGVLSTTGSPPAAPNAITTRGGQCGSRYSFRRCYTNLAGVDARCPAGSQSCRGNSCIARTIFPSRIWRDGTGRAVGSGRRSPRLLSSKHPRTGCKGGCCLRCFPAARRQDCDCTAKQVATGVWTPRFCRRSNSSSRAEESAQVWSSEQTREACSTLSTPAHCQCPSAPSAALCLLKCPELMRTEAVRQFNRFTFLKRAAHCSRSRRDARYGLRGVLLGEASHPGPTIEELRASAYASADAMGLGPPSAVSAAQSSASPSGSRSFASQLREITSAARAAAMCTSIPGELRPHNLTCRTTRAAGMLRCAARNASPKVLSPLACC